MKPSRGRPSQKRFLNQFVSQFRQLSLRRILNSAGPLLRSHPLNKQTKSWAVNNVRPILTEQKTSVAAVRHTSA